MEGLINFPNNDCSYIRLATKLLKLTADEKRELALMKGSVKGKERTEQLEDMIIELQEKIRGLEKHKANLMGKVTILKQQLESRGKRHTHFDRIQPKVNSVILEIFSRQ